ncbi:MAG: phosphoribosylglycinamide formyltransferase [Fibrobacter sp.]|nr:phosphoribosylglycinamide formyltransferase [Fibrobacter sp.]
MFKIGVMASGGGSNFKAIIDQIGEGNLEAQCKFLITNNGGCGAVGHAKTYGIPVYHISGKTHPDEAEYEKALCAVLDERPVDLLILAGYMKKLPDCLVAKMQDRILNIHPSLLPKFGGKGFWGLHVHEAVLAAGEKESGPTVHLVSNEIDQGRILAQRKVPVMPDDTPATLQARVLEQEHDIFWRTIKEYGEALTSKV